MAGVVDKALSLKGRGMKPPGSVHGTADRWIEIQKNTFTNWVNEQLRGRDLRVDDVQEDFKTGIKLVALVEQCQGKRIPRVIQRPMNSHHELENCNLALKAISDDGVKLVNIGSEDIVTGNLKLILGLIWRLILRYQIGKTKFPPKKLMVAWLRAVIPECRISNFTSDWNDGVALSALVDYCKPGLFPNWRSLRWNSGVENLRDSMETANREFDVPMVVRPEDMASTDLDELSCMTYLSYFMNVNSPGYNATLRWAQDQIKSCNITNFTNDWDDGFAICALVKSLGGNIPGWPDLDKSDKQETCQLGMDAAKKLGVDPILTSAEITDPEREHLGVMAYVASFQHVTPLLKSSADKVSVYTDLKLATIGKPAKFKVTFNEEDVRKEDIFIEVRGPEGNLSTESIWTNSGGDGTFIPSHVGSHTLTIRCNGDDVAGFPINFRVFCDRSKVKVSHVGQSKLGELTDITIEGEIDTSQAGDGDLVVHARAPSSHVQKLSVNQVDDGIHTAKLSPGEVGDWELSVLFEGEHINGSPLLVKVIDENMVHVLDLTDGQVGQQMEFKVDTMSAGVGNVRVDITRNGEMIPVTLTQIGTNNVVDFTPDSAGRYFVRIFFNGNEVRGSPYSVNVKDTTSVSAMGEGLTLAAVNRLTSFEVSARGATLGDVIVKVTDPSGNQIPVKVYNVAEDLFKAEYRVELIGDHLTDILYCGKPIKGSPFVCETYDSRQVRVTNVPKNSMIGRDVKFNIDAKDAGSGNLEISVNSGTVPCSVQNRGNKNYHAVFKPLEAVDHLIDMKFNNDTVPGSPWAIPISTLRDLKVRGLDAQQLLPVNKTYSFDVDTGDINDGVLEAFVRGPSGSTEVANVYSMHDGKYKVEFTPHEVGFHTVEILYEGQPIPGGHSTIKTYDHTAIRISPMPKGNVGKPVEFDVDVTQAGEGQLEIMINRGHVPNTVNMLSKGVFRVVFEPVEATPHLVDVFFNKQEVPDCPITCNVRSDASRVTVSGLVQSQLVRSNKLQDFTISGGTHKSDLSINIKGPDDRDVSVKLYENGDSTYRVEWTPHIAGEYSVSVLYGGSPIKGSPFLVRVCDPSKVVVSDVAQGRIGRASSFNIDASRAGSGNLEIIVSVNGENVPNFVQAGGNAQFVVSFTPQISDTHVISVKFNSEAVPGSPFYCSVVDGTRCAVSGDGLRSVPINRMTWILVDPRGSGSAECNVEITSPSGRSVPTRTTGNSNSGYRVEYTPTEIGRHKLQVEYADVEVPGSPFFCETYDANHVVVSHISKGVIGKPITFEVDASKAGDGTLEAEVSSRGQRVHSSVRNKGNQAYDVTFTPNDQNTHVVDITFNGEHVRNSPFMVDVIDSSHVRAVGEALRCAPVHKEAFFEIDPHGPSDAEVFVKVTGPLGMSIPCRVVRQGSMFRCEFTPVEVGRHMIDITFGGVNLPGSPFVCEVYDTSKLKITNVDYQGRPGDQMGFTVDASLAGQGDIDAEVLANNHPVRCTRAPIGNNCHRYTYYPEVNTVHLIDVTFNYEKVPGLPLRVQVGEPRQLEVARPVGSSYSTMMKQTQTFVVENTGSPYTLNSLSAVVKAPSGEQVASQIIQMPEGDFKVEYSSPFTGRHTIDIYFNGQRIPGCPYYVDIYDPTRVRVERIDSSSFVSRETGFNIVVSEAGKADLKVNIISPSGASVPCELHESSQGIHVSYTPREFGVYTIHVTYGGQDIPGSPILQEIRGGGTASAYGEGLTKGEEDRPATFWVDSHGLKGDLFVQVDGPNSIAKCNIDPEKDGLYAVTYVPVEVGIYNIQIKWNGQEVSGSPFHAKVVDSRKVHVIGGWQSLLDSNDRIQLSLNETKRIQFEVQDAGPGKLMAEVVGPNGSVPVDIQQTSPHIYTLSFVPRIDGDYKVSVWWSDIPLPKSPYYATVRSAASTIDHTKVVLTGRGLKEARVNQESEFIIDGSEAGPGRPEIRLSGMKTDADVHVSALGGNRYRCTYNATLSGAYLLHITWNGKQVRGAPFKVNIAAASDASKVIASGEGLKMGIMSKESKSIIDTRRAGPGELTAYCMGPHQAAHCELFDHKDGTFTLTVHPQEAGKHTLSVKYGGENIAGSPFTLKVSGAPDASKVRVTGPGVEPGLLATFQSRFIVETRGAGAGQLTVRIRGPKGAFRVEMQRESQKDRTILCRYDPTETGDYLLHVKWSGEHVPGSPFHVPIFDTHDELERFVMQQQQGSLPRHHGGSGHQPPLLRNGSAHGSSHGHYDKGQHGGRWTPEH